ncbi:uncharacterized protein LOC106638734 [Copidosoma floridanum]|uniref:uncharacterized protein LOC106638734 n=1 Tax=Copidosoma floridanum TaxID=29053 RepID=UPI0006C9623F|nr:uncharacterized protein LOC106638734 [Copidosoma floridanum]
MTNTYCILCKWGEPHCFKFSWLGPRFGAEQDRNCSDPKFKTIPCIEPFEVNPSLPNFTDIWHNKNRSEYGCLLRPGYSCVKYTYKFNNAIVNSSFFCGKMVRDTINVIEKGCFTQKVGGYEFEACTCRSKNSRHIPWYK